MFMKLQDLADKVFAEFAVERKAITTPISAVRRCTARGTDHTENPVMR